MGLRRTARCDWWATAKQDNEEQLSPMGQSSGKRRLAQCWGAGCADKPQCKEGGVTSGRQNVVFALFSIVALFYNCVERFPSLNVCSEVQRRLLCSSNPAGQPGLGAGWGLNSCLLCVGTGWALSVKVVCPALLGPAPVTSSVAWSIYALWAVIWCPFWISHRGLVCAEMFYLHCEALNSQDRAAALLKGSPLVLRFRRHWKAPLQLCGATSGLCARICLCWGESMGYIRKKRRGGSFCCPSEKTDSWIFTACTWKIWIKWMKHEIVLLKRAGLLPAGQGNAAVIFGVKLFGSSTTAQGVINALPCPAPSRAGQVSLALPLPPASQGRGRELQRGKRSGCTWTAGSTTAATACREPGSLPSTSFFLVDGSITPTVQTLLLLLPAPHTAGLLGQFLQKVKPRRARSVRCFAGSPVSAHRITYRSSPHSALLCSPCPHRL